MTNNNTYATIDIVPTKKQKKVYKKVNDKTDLNTNHDDMSVMRVLLQNVKGLSWTSTSSPVYETVNEDE